MSTPTAEALAALERFALQPATRVTWSKDLGRVSSGQAEATVTAAVFEDRAQGRRMLGVRITFTSPEATDRVFVAKEFLQPLSKALSDIETQAEELLRTAGSSSRCFGSCEFLSAMREGAHFFHASQCSMSDGWSGLSVSTGARTFRFTGLGAAPFKAALARAAEELRQRE